MDHTLERFAEVGAERRAAPASRHLLVQKVDTAEREGILPENGSPLRPRGPIATA